MYLLILVNGISSVGRVNGGFIYFTEASPDSHHGALGTTWNIFEGSAVIILTIYWRFISTKW
jgi:hypothetical protein